MINVQSLCQLLIIKITKYFKWSITKTEKWDRDDK